MTLIVQMGALLLQSATSGPETTFVRTAPVGPGWYTVFTEVAGAVSSIVFIVLMVILIPVVRKVRKTATHFSEVLKRIVPVTQHASRIADNIDYVTTAVRADVQDVRHTLHDAHDRVREVLDESERRLHELGALLRLVQEEAEHAFVSTAATVRGLQVGAATLRHGESQLPDDGGLDDDFDDLDAVADAAEETDDGYDNGPAYERAEPRVKRRRRRDSA